MKMKQKATIDKNEQSPIMLAKVPPPVEQTLNPDRPISFVAKYKLI
jgi:hypothetical protein